MCPCSGTPGQGFSDEEGTAEGGMYGPHRVGTQKWIFTGESH